MSLIFYDIKVTSQYMLSKQLVTWWIYFYGMSLGYLYTSHVSVQQQRYMLHIPESSQHNFCPLLHHEPGLLSNFHLKIHVNKYFQILSSLDKSAQLVLEWTGVLCFIHNAQ